MKLFKITFLCSSILLSSLSFASTEPNKDNTIDVDLANDGYVDRILVTPESVKIFKGSDQKTFLLLHEFSSKSINLCRFNQYNIVDGRLETIFGHDISSVFSVRNDNSLVRYSSVQNTLSKDKFIIADLNNDGLPDFIKVEEPSSVNDNSYSNSIYYQNKDGSFSDVADKVIKEKRSSWISGIYYDVNNDGVPEKIEIKYKHYGALLSNTKCTINIYLLNDKTGTYKDKPDMNIISTGTFYEKNNFTDINNDGHPDIFIIDIPQKPHSIKEVISKIFDKRVDIDIKFYLYKDGAGGYPPTPSFVKKINVDILKDFTISFVPSSDLSEYKDLVITQPHHSERHVFNPKKSNFE